MVEQFAESGVCFQNSARRRDALSSPNAEPPPGVTWELADLDDKLNMHAGLHLLYNKIYGKTETHFDMSIHIRYQAFPRDIVDEVDKNRMVEWGESLDGKGGEGVAVG